MNVTIVPFDSYHGRPIGSIGSSVIRARWLAEAWPEAQVWANGQQFDALILQKAYWKDMLEDFKGAKILDLCDPDWLNPQETGCNLVELGSKVDAITCSTDGIRDFVKQCVKHIPVITIPDRLNLNYFTVEKQHTERAKNVVWFGYYHNAQEVLPSVLPSLKRLGVSLTVISNAPFQPDLDYGVEVLNTVWTPESAYFDIQQSDFAINPPSRRGGFKYKSNNKTLISWGLGLPVANSAEDLERFVDPSERTKEAALRKQEILEKWDIKLSVQQYQDLLCDIQNRKKSE